MVRDSDYFVKTSYSADDVTLLLKDVTGLVQPQPTEERERLIQSGRHYCEMLPIEYVPTRKYMQVSRRRLRSEGCAAGSSKRGGRTSFSSRSHAPVYRSAFSSGAT